MNKLHPFWEEFYKNEDQMKSSDTIIHKHIDKLISWICLVHRDQVKKELEFYDTNKI